MSVGPKYTINSYYKKVDFSNKNDDFSNKKDDFFNKKDDCTLLKNFFTSYLLGYPQRMKQ